MPTYDYKCNACDHRFEAFQSIKAKVMKKCPECGKNALERLIGTGGAVLFKGSGFYQTDYRSKEYTEAAKKDAPPETKSETKGETKGENKGDSKDKPKSGDAAGAGGSSSASNTGSKTGSDASASKPADKKAS